MDGRYGLNVTFAERDSSGQTEQAEVDSRQRSGNLWLSFAVLRKLTSGRTGWQKSTPRNYMLPLRQFVKEPPLGDSSRMTPLFMSLTDATYTGFTTHAIETQGTAGHVAVCPVRTSAARSDVFANAVAYDSVV